MTVNAHATRAHAPNGTLPRRQRGAPHSVTTALRLSLPTVRRVALPILALAARLIFTDTLLVVDRTCNWKNGRDYDLSYANRSTLQGGHTSLEYTMLERFLGAVAAERNALRQASFG